MLPRGRDTLKSVKERASTSRAKRAVRAIAFTVAFCGVVACAAVLGIDDRSLVSDASSVDGGDASSVDGGTDAVADAAIDTTPRKQACDDATCADAGGKCSVEHVCE